MVPVPAEYMPDFWNRVSSECLGVEVTCLLPNGVIVLVNVNYNATLAEIKEVIIIIITIYLYITFLLVKFITISWVMAYTL